MATPTFKKEVLSGSTNGAPISIASTNSSAPTLIHTGPAGTDNTNMDEVWVWVYNDTQVTGARVNIYYNTTGTPVSIDVYAAGTSPGLPRLAMPGFLVRNSVSIGGVKSTGNSSLVSGYVHQIRNQ